MQIRHAVEADIEAINRIYNAEIAHGVATWDLAPWSREQRRAWLAEHDADHPVLVAEIEGEVVGFGHLSAYRPKAGYRYTREDTVYLDPRFHRRGIGRALLVALIEEAQRIGVHTLIAWIEASNEASIALHRALSFEIAGHEREVGRKFDRWLDLVVMQRMVEPAEARPSIESRPS